MARRSRQRKIIRGANAKPIYPLWEERVWRPRWLKGMGSGADESGWIPIQVPPYTSFDSKSAYTHIAELNVDQEREMRKWAPIWEPDHQGREPAWFRDAVKSATPVWCVHVRGEEEYFLYFRNFDDAVGEADRLAQDFVAAGDYPGAIVSVPGSTARHSSVVWRAYIATGVEPHEYEDEGVEEMEAAWVMYDWLMAQGLTNRAKNYAWAVPKRRRRR